MVISRRDFTPQATPVSRLSRKTTKLDLYIYIYPAREYLMISPTIGQAELNPVE